MNALLWKGIISDTIFFAWPIKLTTSTLIHTKAHTCTHPHMHECKRRNIMLLTHFYLTKISADTIMFLLASGQKKIIYNIKFERVNVALISRALLSSWQCDVRHDSCKCDYLHSSPFHLVHFLDFPLRTEIITWTAYYHNDGNFQVTSIISNLTTKWNRITPWCFFSSLGYFMTASLSSLIQK